MLTFEQLESTVAQLNAVGYPKQGQIKVQLLDTTRIELAAEPFIIERKNASYSTGNDGNWAATVAEADCAVIKQI